MALTHETRVRVPVWEFLLIALRSSRQKFWEETLLEPFISREYPLKKVLRIVSNEVVLVVRLNDEVTTKLSLLEIKAQILEEAKLVRHLQQQEQELEEFQCKLEAANQELQATRGGLREANKELEVTHRRLEEATKELGDTRKGLEEATKELEVTRKGLAEATKELGDTRKGLGEATSRIFSQGQELKRVRSLLEYQNAEITRLEAMNLVEHDLNASIMSDVSLNTSIGSEMSDTLPES